MQKISGIRIPCWFKNGKTVSVKTAANKFNRERLERGKCFNVFCSNNIDYIRMKKYGLVDIGYCSSCYERAKYRSLYMHLTKNRKTTKWFEIISGRLIEDKEK